MTNSVSADEAPPSLPDAVRQQLRTRARRMQRSFLLLASVVSATGLLLMAVHVTRGILWSLDGVEDALGDSLAMGFVFLLNQLLLAVFCAGAGWYWAQRMRRAADVGVAVMAQVQRPPMLYDPVKRSRNLLPVLLIDLLSRWFPIRWNHVTFCYEGRERAGYTTFLFAGEEFLSDDQGQGLVVVDPARPSVFYWPVLAEPAASEVDSSR